MKRQDALYAAACIGAIAFAVVFVLPHFTAHAVPLYWVLDRRWELAPPTANGIAIDFYGRCFEAAVAWAISVVATLVVTKRLRTERLPPKLASLLAAWAIALTVLVMMYYAWTLAFRVPNAAPIPDWYVPR